MTLTRSPAVLVIAAACIAVSCSGSEATDSEVVVDGIAVIDAWVRPTPPGSDEAAIYVTIGNRTDGDSAVLGAASPQCLTIVPHATSIDDGIASMGVALDDQLALPSEGRVVMEPNGLHLMCLGLVEPLQTGDEFEVTIDLAGREPIDLTVTVDQR